MKKSIPAAVGFLIAFNSVVPSAQTVAFGTLSPADVQVFNQMEQAICAKSGGYVFTAVADAAGVKLPQTVGGKPVLYCRCAQGLIYYFPSGGCVKRGVGSIPQTNQPAKKMN
jgi:hypothetical protein